jgi:lactoylglutathione lyase
MRSAITGVRTIGVPVADQDRAVEFYVAHPGPGEAAGRPGRGARRTLDRGGAPGVGVDELLAWEGVPPTFAFRDPDGNGLEITEETAQ